MITTDHVPGSPCWMDVGAPDIDAAVAFYGAVFGWEYQSFGPDTGGHGFFRLDGKSVAALGPLEEGARSAWMIYFATPDTDSAARTVEQSGGTVRVAPMDVADAGRIAQFSDPLGGQFAVWQPRRIQGLELVDAPGSLTWVEHMTTDSAAAKEFYGTLFGWTTSDISLPGGGGTYSSITPAGRGEEHTQGGLVQLDAAELDGGRPYWHPVFRVTDCDTTAGRVTGNGGTLAMGPEDAEGIGRLAVCLDPAGAEFVLLAPAGS